MRAAYRPQPPTAEKAPHSVVMRRAFLLLGCTGIVAGVSPRNATPPEQLYDYQNHPETAIIDFSPEATAEDGVMKLVMMKDKGLSGMGAVCLDGTDAGFYFSPSTGGDANKNKWQLYFQGGGW
jgi:hypothetical protein